ncbi:PREDICTED: outer envelope protein 64, chloroplastic [Nicotiana attenuata]|uniref:Outer envelope protein 64, chloroplastic n=1 Tax=Nicotiana attenuata TaxID=49451 RepID=A0A314KVB4_NICAT|nr:PREDICTED: outer envelope protein 64, chloroplastic [Nicotiana attenuata]OIT33300.1 outer envelope protein 64, chloroplastic [Nicotiana attenuata]
MASQAANLWVLLGLGLAGILIMTRKLKKAVKADFGAFVERLQLLPPPQPPPPKAPHPLTGLSFAISDVFDVNGFVTGFGNPEWSRTHEPASQTSPVVSALVEGGATCTGRTVVDDMAFGISGEHIHYDTPTNPAAPARIPGGSSSGAAVAVAAKFVDFSLGIDAVGGVRVPAAYCGVLGFRPSHGTVAHTGIIPVSASLDTVGWLARDPSILRRVGHVLLQVPFASQRNPRNVVIADDCFQSVNSGGRISQAVIKAVEKLFGRQIIRHENLEAYLNSKIPSLKQFASKKSNSERKSSSTNLLAYVMHILKRHEFKQNHLEWINAAKPNLDPVISAQIQGGPEITDTNIENCHAVRNELRSALNDLLKDDGILVIPTVSEPPPKIGAKEIQSEDYQIRSCSFSSIASMSGGCQVCVPMGFHDKCPTSVSFVVRQGGDRFLLDTIQSMYASIQEQAEVATKSSTSGNAISKEASAEMAKEKGNQAYKDKQWQKAIGFYTEAIKLNGNTATYFSNRAAAYLEMRNFIQAEADSSKAIDLDKKNVKAYLRRGTAREMLGYYKEAIEDFRYALVLEPTNKRASQSADRLKKLFP